MKATEYLDIGRYLKDSRESLKVSVVEAAQAMHIRVHYIEALESGNLDVLPGKAYVRGYIRNYAIYLRIDVDKTLAAYDALSGNVKQELYIPEPTIKENLPSKTLMFCAIAAAIMILTYYAIFMKEPHRIINTVADVPAGLLLAVESNKNERNTEWMECLNNNVNECFNTLLARETLTGIEKGRAGTVKFLAGI